MSLCLTTDSPNATLALGRRFSTCLAAGDVVLLSGRLGVGKTLFVQGVAEGLGIGERITSPSFVISRTYRDGFTLLVHADVYRIGSIAEFEDLELVDDASEGVLFIEWGDTVAEAIGPDHLTIHMAMEGDERTIAFEPSGTWLSRDLGVMT
jgi:tRNA threonylcarbamoyladenosine biosynthesis protein TsaE